MWYLVMKRVGEYERCVLFRDHKLINGASGANEYVHVMQYHDKTSTLKAYFELL